MEPWQYAAEQRKINTEVTPENFARIENDKNEEQKLVARYVELRVSGLSDSEAFGIVKLESGRPNLDMQAYQEDSGDVDELVLMWG